MSKRKIYNLLLDDELEAILNEVSFSLKVSKKAAIFNGLVALRNISGIRSQAPKQENTEE